MNGLQTVQIDLFTTVAQIINFLILLYLLKRLLYQPVLNLMKEREKQIFSRLEEAEDKMKAAEREAESYRKKKEEISSEHEELLIKAKEDAKNYKVGLMNEAREEVEESKKEWYSEVRREKEAFLDDLRRGAGEQLYAISRRALRDLADVELESRIIDIFIKRLQNLEEHEKETIKEFYLSLKQPVTVRSSFEISEDAQEKIEKILKDQAGRDLVVQFQIDEDLISGIEMSARNLEISWNISSYLDSLEADFSRLLEEKTHV